MSGYGNNSFQKQFQRDQTDKKSSVNEIPYSPRSQMPNKKRAEQLTFLYKNDPTNINNHLNEQKKLLNEAEKKANEGYKRKIQSFIAGMESIKEKKTALGDENPANIDKIRDKIRNGIYDHDVVDPKVYSIGSTTNIARDYSTETIQEVSKHTPTYQFQYADRPTNFPPKEIGIGPSHSFIFIESEKKYSELLTDVEIEGVKRSHFGYLPTIVRSKLQSLIDTLPRRIDKGQVNQSSETKRKWREFEQYDDKTIKTVLNHIAKEVKGKIKSNSL